MRRKQRRDKRGVDSEPHRPWPILHHQHGGDAPQRNAEAEFEIHEAPGKRQAVQKHQRDKAGKLDAAFHHTFERYRPADDHYLAEQ